MLVCTFLIKKCSRSHSHPCYSLSMPLIYHFLADLSTLSGAQICDVRIIQSSLPPSNGFQITSVSSSVIYTFAKVQCADLRNYYNTIRHESKTNAVQSTLAVKTKRNSMLLTVNYWQFVLDCVKLQTFYNT